MEISRKEVDIQVWSLKEKPGWKYRAGESKAVLVDMGVGETK